MSDILYYRVQKTISDSVNHLDLLAGSFVATDQDKWVARMGNLLQKLPATTKLPPGETCHSVLKSIEGKTEVVTQSVEEPKKDVDDAKPKKTTTKKPSLTRAVLGNKTKVVTGEDNK